MNFLSYRLSFLKFQAIQKLFPNGTTVIFYHSVGHRNSDPLSLSISKSNFESQIKAFKKNLTIISPHQFYLSLKNKQPIPRSLLITFDDGYQDNLTTALPILKKHSIPALFFISTYYIKNKYQYWWEEYDSLSENKFFKKKFSLHSPKLKISGLHRPLTLSQLKKLSQSKYVYLGGHTHSHPQLSSLSFHRQLSEIKTNLNLLKKVSPKPLHFFAYPYGNFVDYNRSTLKIVSRYYPYAFTTMPFVANSNFPAHQLPRFSASNVTGNQMLKKIYLLNQWEK